MQFSTNKLKLNRKIYQKVIQLKQLILLINVSKDNPQIVLVYMAVQKLKTTHTSKTLTGKHFKKKR